MVEKIDDDAGKAKALAEAFSLKPDAVSVSGGQMKVTFGDKVEKDSKFLVNKSNFVNSALRYMGKIEKVVVEEDYARAKEEAKGK